MKIMLIVGIVACSLCMWLLLMPIGLDIGTRRYLLLGDLRKLAYLGWAGPALIVTETPA